MSVLDNSFSICIKGEQEDKKNKFMNYSFAPTEKGMDVPSFAPSWTCSQLTFTSFELLRLCYDGFACPYITIPMNLKRLF
jgi:hypothetical protein